MSTADQRPDTPIAHLTRYASGIGAHVAMVRTEIHSGRTDGPGLQAILAAARAGAINMVIVQRLDRVGRRLVNIVRNIEQLISDGCRFDVVDQSLIIKPGGDYTSRSIMHVLAMVAELEHAMTIERTREGVAAARARGRRLGRPPSDALDVAIVNRLAAGGASLRQIAAQLGCSTWAVRQVAATCINCGRDHVDWRPCRRCGAPVCSCGHHRGSATALADEAQACAEIPPTKSAAAPVESRRRRRAV